MAWIKSHAGWIAGAIALLAILLYFLRGSSASAADSTGFLPTGFAGIQLGTPVAGGSLGMYGSNSNGAPGQGSGAQVKVTPVQPATPAVPVTVSGPTVATGKTPASSAASVTSAAGKQASLMVGGTLFPTSQQAKVAASIVGGNVQVSGNVVGMSPAALYLRGANPTPGYQYVLPKAKQLEQQF